jgi:type III pantothenate kinase
MIPHVVVDIGNSRIKWGRCEAGPVTEFASLAHDRPGDWVDQAQRWGLAKPARWIVAGVHPHTREQLTDWIRQRGDTVVVLASARELPLRTRLEHPDKAGIDRLFNAVAVNARRKQGMPAVAVDAGSAVTVDFSAARSFLAYG